jgi:hypothetical protein
MHVGVSVRFSFRILIQGSLGRGEQHKSLQQIEGEHCPSHWAIFHRSHLPLFS